MNKLIMASLALLLASSLNAQNVNFSNNDDFIKVTQGNVVTIKADTAYVVSKGRAAFLNEKLDELQEIQKMYNGIVANEKELKKELKNVQKLIGKLAASLEKDSAAISNNVIEIVDDLDDTLSELRESNTSLKQNNQTLLARTVELKRIVKDLRKETRGLWWNGLTDKLVAFAGGVGIGILLAAAL